LNYRKRKCACCDKYIVHNDIDDVVMYKKKFYHKNCFCDYKLNHARPKWDEHELQKQLPQLLADTKKYLEHQNHFDELNMFIADNYDFYLIPKPFYERIRQIDEGTFYKITKPIPIEDILDMWQQKLPYFKKLHIKKNMKEDAVNTLYYDLAILCSKYNNYLNWKENKKAEKQEIKKYKQEQANSKVIYNTQDNIDNSDDISNILDEI